MIPTITQLIQQNFRIAYAMTDREMAILEVSGAVDLLCRDGCEVFGGRPLLDMVPELLGNEAALAQLLSGELPHFQLDRVNRESATGQPVYLTLKAFPYQDQQGQLMGLILLAQDVTELGVSDQRLTQQRNELYLLQDKLSRLNQELVAANAVLQQQVAFKSGQVAMALKELRSLLSSISNCPTPGEETDQAS